MITAVLLLLAQPQNAAFSAVLEKLGASDGITFTFEDLTVSGTSRTWTLKVRRPNLLIAISESHTISADGDWVFVFEKRTNSFEAGAQTQSSLAKLLERPELLPARLYLDPKGEWVSSGRSAVSRKRRGVALSGTVLTPIKDQSATVYFGTSDLSINHIIIETDKDRKKETRILDRFKVEHEEHPVLSFVFIPSPDAREVSGAGSTTDSSLKESAEGSVPYRKLTWDDYRTVAGRPRRIIAYTDTYLRWNYETQTSRSGGRFVEKVKTIEIESGLNKLKSWKVQLFRLREPDRVLAHEQGHLDINEIQAMALRRIKPDDWPKGSGSSRSSASADLSAQVQRVVSAAIAEASARQDLYDIESKNGFDIPAQLRWDQKLASELSGGSDH